MEGDREISAPYVTCLTEDTESCIDHEPQSASDVTPSSSSLSIPLTLDIEDKRRRSYKSTRKCFESVVVGGVIATVWVLLILPVALYNLPVVQQPISNNVTNSSLSWCNASDLNCTIVCHEGFYFDEAVGYCRPDCGQWRGFSTTVQPVRDALIIIGAVCGIIAGIAVIVLAYFRHRKVFKFPSVFVIFQNTSLSLYTLFILISYTDKEALFCSFDDVVESVNNPTPFSTILGIVTYYALLQLGLWLVFHVVCVFWSVVFPFHKRKLDAEGKTKYIYFTMVLLGLILPWVPVAVTLGNGGFVAIDAHYPSTGRYRTYTVYSFILAESILVATGISLLIIVFRKIIKVYGFNLKRSKGVELRILIVFSYYAILGVSSLTAFTVSSRRLPGYINARDVYFLCERNSTGTKCDGSLIEDFSSPALLIIGTILVEIFPAVNLVYVIHIADLKKLKQRCAPHCNKAKASDSAVLYANASILP